MKYLVFSLAESLGGSFQKIQNQQLVPLQQQTDADIDADVEKLSASLAMTPPRINSQNEEV
jgi:hypothetical protein